MIPKRARLVLRFKLVEEGPVLADWTLGDKRCTVNIVCTVLKDSVPMLKEV